MAITKKNEEKERNLVLLSEEQLNALSFNELREYAVSVGVKGAGKRAEITANILKLSGENFDKVPEKVQKEADNKVGEKEGEKKPSQPKKAKGNIAEASKDREKPSKRNTKPKREARTSVAKRQPSRPKRNMEQFIYSNQGTTDTMVGVASEDIQAEAMKFNISNAEKSEENFRLLKRYQQYEEILWGTLISVTKMTENNMQFNVVKVLWNDIEVVIPDFLFIEPGYKYGATYADMSEAQKLRRRHSMLSYMLGAKVCFTIKEVSRDLIDDKENPAYGSYDLLVVGNRNRAMEILRDIYFFHENRKDTTRGEARSIKPGDVVTARIVQVKEENILVECGGAEARIPADAISGDRIYTNCTDVYKSGDSINVRVKKVYLNKDKSVHLSLTGQIVDPLEAISNVTAGSTYSGVVFKVDKEQQTYTIMLSNKVPCHCKFQYVIGHVPLVKGDRVRVTVANVYREKGFVGGRAQKI